MRVFRTTYKDRAGRTKQAAKWYVEFKDHAETIRRIPGFTDKKQTAELGSKLEKLVGCRVNCESPTPELTKWLESMGTALHDKLAAIGLITTRYLSARRTLADHLIDFQADLTAKGATKNHVALTAARARAVVEGCKFRLWSDLSASKIECYLAKLRTGSETAAGLSIQTSNFYLQAIKQFCRWMVRDGRASESPINHLQRLNVETDRRHDRRALSLDEVRWLLATTESGPKRRGLCATDRVLLYRLSLETGLRSNEIRSLTKASFNFDGKQPTVTVAAGYSKRRREDVLPLRVELANLLRDHLAAMLPAVAAFAMPKKAQVLKALKDDLTAARAAWVAAAPAKEGAAQRKGTDFLAYRDTSGRVADFHALRHTFITNLANSGVHPKVAQTLARHSTIQLTMDRYTHTVWESLSDALDRLPDLSAQSVIAHVATGTNGVEAVQAVEAADSAIGRRELFNGASCGEPVLAFRLAQNVAETRNAVQRDAVNVGTATAVGADANHAHSSDNIAIPRKTSSESACEAGKRKPRRTHSRTVLETGCSPRSTLVFSNLTIAAEHSSTFR